MGDGRAGLVEGLVLGLEQPLEENPGLVSAPTKPECPFTDHLLLAFGGLGPVGANLQVELDLGGPATMTLGVLAGDSKRDGVLLSKPCQRS